MNGLNEIRISDSLRSNINNLITSNRLPHSIMIYGGNKKQRAYLSDFFAKVFVCSSANKPCGTCRNCLKADSASHPDITISDPDTANEKTFKVGVVRDIRTDAYIVPNEAQNKVYILRNADKMNPQAQNAMLKIIEEPPEHTRFIFECDSASSMLETIISRVTMFNLGAGIGDYDDKIFTKADDLAAKLASALLSPTELEFMRLTAEFEKDYVLFEAVLPSFKMILRDAVVIKSNGNIILSDYKDTARSLASRFTLMTLIELTEKTESFSLAIEKNANKNLLITRFCSVFRQTAYDL